MSLARRHRFALVCVFCALFGVDRIEPWRTCQPSTVGKCEQCGATAGYGQYYYTDASGTCLVGTCDPSRYPSVLTQSCELCTGELPTQYSADAVVSAGLGQYYRGIVGLPCRIYNTACYGVGMYLSSLNPWTQEKTCSPCVPLEGSLSMYYYTGPGTFSNTSCTKRKYIIDRYGQKSTWVQCLDFDYNDNAYALSATGDECVRCGNGTYSARINDFPCVPCGKVVAYAFSVLPFLATCLRSGVCGGSKSGCVPILQLCASGSVRIGIDANGAGGYCTPCTNSLPNSTTMYYDISYHPTNTTCLIGTIPQCGPGTYYVSKYSTGYYIPGIDFSCEPCSPGTYSMYTHNYFCFPVGYTCTVYRYSGWNTMMLGPCVSTCCDQLCQLQTDGMYQDVFLPNGTASACKSCMAAVECGNKIFGCSGSGCGFGYVQTGCELVNPGKCVSCESLVADWYQYSWQSYFTNESDPYDGLGIGPWPGKVDGVLPPGYRWTDIWGYSKNRLRTTVSVTGTLKGRVCPFALCSICAKGQRVNKTCTNNYDTICTDCIENLYWFGQPLTFAGQAYALARYVSVACTQDRDSILALCDICGPGTYQLNGCQGFVNRKCAACPVISGYQSFTLQNNDMQCTACGSSMYNGAFRSQLCNSGYYISNCSASTSEICTPCESCPVGQARIGCNGFSKGTCGGCSNILPSGYYFTGTNTAGFCSVAVCDVAVFRVSYYVSLCTSQTNAVVKPCTAKCPVGTYITTSCSTSADMACANCASGYWANGINPDKSKIDHGSTSCTSCTNSLQYNVFLDANILSTACAAGQYLISCNNATGGVCGNCRTCPSGQILIGCSDWSSGNCVQCLNSITLGLLYYIATAPNVDNYCDANLCSGCKPGFYPSRACTLTTDTVCSPCTTTCPIGYYLSGYCSMQGDVTCTQCDLPAPGKVFTGVNCITQDCTKPDVLHYITRNCTPFVDNVLTSCSVCFPGSYISKACSTYTDTVCTYCPPGTFSMYSVVRNLVYIAEEMYSVCHDCRIPAADEYYLAPCTGTDAGRLQQCLAYCNPGTVLVNCTSSTSATCVKCANPLPPNSYYINTVNNTGVCNTMPCTSRPSTNVYAFQPCSSTSDAVFVPCNTYSAPGYFVYSACTDNTDSVVYKCGATSYSNATSVTACTHCSTGVPVNWYAEGCGLTSAGVVKPCLANCSLGQVRSGCGTYATPASPGACTVCANIGDMNNYPNNTVMWVRTISYSGVCDHVDCTMPMDGFYISTKCTWYTDSVMSQCRLCLNGKFLSTACSRYLDTACVNCPVGTFNDNFTNTPVCPSCGQQCVIQSGVMACVDRCKRGTQYSLGCGGAIAGVCTDCVNICPRGQVLVQCKLNTPGYCSPCVNSVVLGQQYFIETINDSGVCNTSYCLDPVSGFYISTNCTIYMDNIMSQCHTCSSGKYMDSACSRYRDVVCNSCPVGTYNNNLTNIQTCPQCGQQCVLTGDSMTCIDKCNPGTQYSLGCGGSNAGICTNCVNICPRGQVLVQCKLNTPGYCAPCTNNVILGLRYLIETINDNGVCTTLPCDTCVTGVTWSKILCNTLNNTVCSACTVCPTGYYILTQCTSTSDTVCSKCPPYTYSTVPNSNQCSTCAAGCGANSWAQGCYSTSAGTCQLCGSCTAPLIRLGCSLNNSGTCQLCPNSLPPGSYYTSTLDANSQCVTAACSVCDTSQQYMLSNCSFSNNAICSPLTTCRAGTYVSKLSGNFSDRQCSSCSAGTYTTSTNSVACLQCGSNCDIYSDYYVTDCVPTSAGTCQKCQECVAGFSRSGCGGNSSGNCTVCINYLPMPGYRIIPTINYVSYCDQKRCATCNSTSYVTFNCSYVLDTVCANCSICNPGWYISSNCSQYTNTVCSPCAPDTFSTQTNTQQCTRCYQRNCAAGQYVNKSCTSTSDITCAACPNNTFSSQVNANQCVSCNVYGLATCTDNQSFISGCGSNRSGVCTRCGECPKYMKRIQCKGNSSGVCRNVTDNKNRSYTAGYYFDLSGPNSANSDTAVALMVQCSVCDAKHYRTRECDWNADTKCDLCAPGSYSTVANNDACVDCPAGTYYSDNASLPGPPCVVCSPGYTTILTAQLSCISCLDLGYEPLPTGSFWSSMPNKQCQISCYPWNGVIGWSLDAIYHNDNGYEFITHACVECYEVSCESDKYIFDYDTCDGINAATCISCDEYMMKHFRLEALPSNANTTYGWVVLSVPATKCSYRCNTGYYNTDEFTCSPCAEIPDYYWYIYNTDVDCVSEEKPVPQLEPDTTTPVNAPLSDVTTTEPYIEQGLLTTATSDPIEYKSQTVAKTTTKRVTGKGVSTTTRQTSPSLVQPRTSTYTTSRTASSVAVFVCDVKVASGAQIKTPLACETNVNTIKSYVTSDIATARFSDYSVFPIGITLSNGTNLMCNSVKVNQCNVCGLMTPLFNVSVNSQQQAQTRRLLQSASGATIASNKMCVIASYGGSISGTDSNVLFSKTLTAYPGSGVVYVTSLVDVSVDAVLNSPNATTRDALSNAISSYYVSIITDPGSLQLSAIDVAVMAVCSVLFIISIVFIIYKCLSVDSRHEVPATATAIPYIKLPTRIIVKE